MLPSAHSYDVYLVEHYTLLHSKELDVNQTDFRPNILVDISTSTVGNYCNSQGVVGPRPVCIWRGITSADKPNRFPVAPITPVLG